MVIRRVFRSTSLGTHFRAFLLIVACSVVLAGAGVVAFATMPVHAELLPRPAITAPPAAPQPEADPAILAPARASRRGQSDLLHGLASWYGGAFNGRKTASGERFNMFSMTACHPTLPFGTLVQVVNLDNNRSVVVRITDRGYLFEGRIIDLSYGAAQKIAMTRKGLAHVELRVLSLGGGASAARNLVVKDKQQ